MYDVQRILTMDFFYHAVGAWFSLGADLDARRDEHQAEALKLRQCLKDFLNAVEKFFFALPLYKIFPTPLLKNANKAIDDLYGITRVYADQHMERIKSNVGKGDRYSGQSLLEQWLAEGKLSEQEAIKNASTMMAVGLDTVSFSTILRLF